MNPDAALLIVDDNDDNRYTLKLTLSRAGYTNIATAENGNEALALAGKRRFDLMLLDVMMPGLDGFKVCEQLQADEATRDIPVIFLTALDGTFDKVRAFAAGAVDYVTKPFESEELLARVNTHLVLRETRQLLEEQNILLRDEIEAHRRARGTIECLVEEIRSSHGFTEILGESPALTQLLKQVELVAATDSAVLIQGESGTGKELVARAIHGRSGRRDRPLIKINCAALPRDLVESELFGHEKGAFTGATQQRQGRFELADGGTIFLDEVGEMPLETQPKLLRALQEREFERVGGSRTLRTDVRVIAATNRDLRQQVAAGTFRADLYYRLNVFPLAMPPLRERRDDIPLLVRHFLARLSRKLGKPLSDIEADLVARADGYAWPGNVRELENYVERSAILGTPALIDAAVPDAALQPSGTLEELEREHILRVLEQTRWAVAGDGGAASILGLNPSTLRGRMRKLGIRRGE